jgi:hypothetical protein
VYYKDEGQWFDSCLNPVEPCEDLQLRQPEPVTVMLLSTYDATPMASGMTFSSDEFALRGTLAAAPNGSMLVLQAQVSALQVP